MTKGGLRQGAGRPEGTKKEQTVVFYKRMTAFDKLQMQTAWAYLQQNGLFNFNNPTELDALMDYAHLNGVHNGPKTNNDFIAFYHTNKYKKSWDDIIKDFKGGGRKNWENELKESI